MTMQTSPRLPATSGRTHHAEKITVYLTPDELARLERAALAIRHREGLKVDRGRIVRDALAIVLDDLEHSARAGVMPRLIARLREIR